MLTSPLVLVALVAAAVCLGGGLLIGWWIARARLSQIELQLAWSQVETAPAAALKTFRKAIARTGKTGSAKQLGTRHRLQVGAALCLIRLGRLDEAAESLEQIAPTAEEQGQLCAAYLAAAPSPVPEEAVAAYAGYLALPEKKRIAELSRRVRAALESALTPANKASAAEVEAALAAGKSILGVLPDADWVLLALGRIYSRAGQWKEAAALLQKAVAANPNNAEHQQALGRARRALGQLREARAAFLAAHRLAATAESAYQAGLACLDTLAEPFAEAEKTVAAGRSPAALALALLEQAGSQGQATAAHWTAIGRAHASLGHHAEAITAYEKALLLDVRGAATLAHLARSHLVLGNRPAARQAAQRAFEAGPDLPEVVLLAADLAYADRDYARAVAGYRKLAPAALTSNVVDRYARSLLETGDAAQALSLLQGRTNPDLFASLVRGRAHARLGQWPPALVELQRHDPAKTTAEYRYYLANALAANSKYAEAVALLGGLLSDAAWGTPARRCLGHVKLLSGDRAGARECYAAGAKTTAAYDLGRIHLLDGDAEAARRQFEQAVGQPAVARAASLGLAIASARLGEDAAARQLAEDEQLGPWAVEQLADAAYEERHYVEACELYEKAIRHRSFVASSILCRLAVGYLQLNRYRDALPHLVELVRRSPRVVALRYNLAVCRFRLGQNHFRQGRWDLAREELSRCGQLLAALPQTEAEAAAVRRWEQEATYRSAAALLLAEPARELDRALQLFRSGAQHGANEPRWQLGIGLAQALAGRHNEAGAAFAAATRLVPDRLAFALGEGISLLEHDPAAAGQVLARVTQQTQHAAPPSGPLYQLAARFGQVVAHVRQRQWAEAARLLEALMTHPLVRSSSRLGPVDIAQAAVAYYALAGDRDRAADIAKRHLPEGQTLGNLLIGMVQAESGDYTGATDTLGQAYAQQKQPAVRALLVACLLAAAAERILAQDQAGARPFVQRALEVAPDDKDARRLAQALAFNQNFRNLDLKEIDKTIAQCEKLIESEEPSMQLLRTLGVLYHRRAVSRDQKGRNSEPFWQECTTFWKKRILDTNSFWERYQDEYNAGKGRREQIKPEDVTQWRAELPATFAAAHASYTSAALRNSDPDAARRHLELIWQWKPDFEPPKDFLVADLGEIDERTVNLLTDLIDKVRNKAVRETLGQLAGAYWNRQGAEALAGAVNDNTQSVRQAEVAMQVCNQLASSIAGNPYAAQVLLERTIQELDEALEKSHRARRQLETARDLVDRACKLAPHVPVFAENRNAIRDFLNTVRQNASAIESNRSELRTILNRIR